MKKSKILMLITIVFSIFIVCGCKDKQTDAAKFKEEYESYNGEKNSSGKEYRSIEIDEDNPFIYKTEDELVEMIENKETFIAYFGFSTCPWCRSILPTLIKVAKDNNVDKIYYVDILDIRDTMEIDENYNPVVKKEGTKGYERLLELLGEGLEDYTLTNKDGKTIVTNEKRIYAPNIAAIKDGQLEKLESGVSSLQTDGYMELTDEMINETYEKLECVVKCINESNTCSIDKGC